MDTTTGTVLVIGGILLALLVLAALILRYLHAGRVDEVDETHHEWVLNLRLDRADRTPPADVDPPTAAARRTAARAAMSRSSTPVQPAPIDTWTAGGVYPLASTGTDGGTTCSPDTGSSSASFSDGGGSFGGGDGGASSC